jgi:hypothetical protein
VEVELYLQQALAHERIHLRTDQAQAGVAVEDLLSVQLAQVKVLVVAVFASA